MPEIEAKAPKAQTKRIEALDYLRGWFIIIIVIDHLTRWPNFLQAITGRGELWANASDGFLITSGLLIGYIRGYKDRDKPFTGVVKKLIKRSISLYIWGVITTVVLFSLAMVLPVGPNIPTYMNPGGWFNLVFEAITLNYIHPYTYFLHLYAVYMLFSIGAVWLLRKKLWWVIILVVAGSFIYTQFNSSAIIERIPAFFLPTVIGFYLDPIRDFVTSRKKHLIDVFSIGMLTFFFTTLTLAVIYRFYPGLYSPQVYDVFALLFSRNPITVTSALLSFSWYIGLFILFNQALPLLRKYLSKVILPFSTGSFSAYTVHGVAIIALSLLPLPLGNIFINTALGIAAVLLTILIINTPLVKKVVPQ